jgi:hypothetical protein
MARNNRGSIVPDNNVASSPKTVSTPRVNVDSRPSDDGGSARPTARRPREDKKPLDKVLGGAARRGGRKNR